MINRKIYLVDYIGDHCGMHYYNQAFKITLKQQVNVEILSNYPADRRSPFFLNIYKGSKISGIFCIIINFIRLFFKVLSNRKSYFIYLTYGEYIDLIFILIISLSKNSVIDIHEVIAQRIDSKKWLDKCFTLLYRKKVRQVIVHSHRTNVFLDQYSFQGIRFYVPHFRYCFETEFNEKLIPDEVKLAVDPDRMNVLFFGNITFNKGIDRLVEAVNSIEKEYLEKLNFIVAGKDIDNAVAKISIDTPESFVFLLRHINDDELKYLFSKSDYVVLPYRKTSQSGILEMAFYLKTPIIASRIEYFEQILADFPSFGVIYGECVQELKSTLVAVTKQKVEDFFHDSEYNRYTHRNEIEAFVREFCTWLKINC